VDGRRIYDRDEALALGFTYLGIGAPNSRTHPQAPRAGVPGTQKEISV
jgi:hypothetical protein